MFEIVAVYGAAASVVSGVLESAMGVLVEHASGGRQAIPSRLPPSCTATCRSTALHFVRCIKPNSKQVAGSFDASLILHQLRCCGVLEVARIARAGYPTRYLHADFAARYKAVLPELGPGAHVVIGGMVNSVPTTSQPALVGWGRRLAAGTFTDGSCPLPCHPPNPTLQGRCRGV